MILPHGWLHVIKSKVDVCLLLEFCQLIMERGSVLISIHLDQWALLSDQVVRESFESRLAN